MIGQGKILAIAMLLALLTSGVFAITSCGTNITSSGSYVMENAISDCSGNCIDIQADNVTLDCQGYTMNQICAGNFIFLYTEGRSNITVKNCIIESWYDGIVFNSTNNSFIQNVTTPNGFGNGYAGIRLVNSSHNTISEVSESSNAVMGLLIQDDSDHNLIANSTFDSNADGGIASYIELSGDGNDYNTYKDLNFTNTASSSGISISNGTGNVIKNIYTYNNPNGVTFFYMTNSSMDNITTDASSSFSIAIAFSSNITASNLNTTSGQIGVYLPGTNDSIITNVTQTGASLAGLYLSLSSKNNIINGITIDSNPYGIYMNNATFNTVKNVVVTNSVTNDLRQRNNAQNNVFLNASLNPAAVTWATCAVCNFTVQWYGEVNVTDGITPFPGKVNVSDVNGQSYFSSNAGANGLTPWFAVSDYTKSRNGAVTTTTSYNDYTINASFHGSDLNTTTNTFSTADNIINMTVYPVPDTCGTINDSTMLINDLSSSGTCITFGADNIELDCAGHSITGTSSADTYGVYAEGRSNITVKNCTLLSYYDGILFNSTSNSFITNITANSNGDVGVFLFNYSDSNTVTHINANSNSFFGIALQSASNNILTDVTANSNAYGVYLTSNSDYNNFTDVTANSNAYGVYTILSDNYNVFSNVTVYGNTVYGIYIYDNSTNNLLTNLNVTSNVQGLVVSTNSVNNVFSDIVINSNFFGINLYAYANDNIINNAIIDSNTYSVYFYYAYNDTIANSTITNSITSDIYSDAYAINNVLLNTTFDPAKVTWASCSSCNFTVQWYGEVNVTNPLPADVNVSDVNGQSYFSSTAGVNGLTSWFIISDYLSTDTGDTSFNPYEINASYAGYGTNTTSYSFITPDNIINTTLYPTAIVDTCGTITSSTTLHNDITFAGTCMIFGVDNIELDCNGYTLTGDTTGAGVFASGRANVTTKNCIIQNNTAGIYYYVTSNSFITNVTADNNSVYGILMETSTSNTLTNFSTNNNGVWGIRFITSSDNNVLSDFTVDNNPYSFLFWSSSYNNVTNATINGNGYGIYLISSYFDVFKNFTADNNNIGYGLGVSFSAYNTFTDFTTNNNGGGIFLTYSDSNILSNFTSNNSLYGIALEHTSNNNTFYNFSVDNNSHGVWFTLNSYNNFFANSTISSSTLDDISSNDNTQDNVFLNTTFRSSNVTWSSCAPCNFTVEWYGQVNVTNSTDPLPADVNVSDVYGASAFSGTADGSGLTSWFTVTDYIATDTGDTSFNPHEVNASYTGYDLNTTSYAFTSPDNVVNLTLYESTVANVTPSTCGTITESTTLNQNLTSSGTCITFGADNIELDCDGYSITGDTTGYGIVAGGNTNVTVKNCIVDNFSTGIYFVSTSNSFISNIISKNSVNGIYLETSSNNIITDATTNNNLYGMSIYLSSNNNTLDNVTANNNANWGFSFYTTSNNNNLTDANVSNNAFGLYVYDNSNDNTITNIEASNTLDNGIIIESSFNNIISGITAINNTVRGVYLVYSSNNTLTDVLSNGVWLTTSSNNTFTNVISNDVAYGIGLVTNANYNSFTNLTVTNNTANGIYLNDYSNGNNFTDLTANINNNGVYFETSSNNRITNATVNNNQFGIIIYLLSNNNVFTNVTANFNVNYGLTTITSISNTSITDIVANNNGLYGVLINVDSVDTTISNIETSNNGIYGLYVGFSNNTDVTGITSNNNTDSGIYLEGSYNDDFSGITTLNNGNKGILLWTNANNNTFQNAIAQDVYVYTSSYNVFDNITSSDRTNGIEIVTNSYYNTISNFTALNNTLVGVLLRDNANYNNLSNIIANNNALYGVWVYSPASNNTFLNVTANNNTVHGFYIFDNSNNNTITDITTNNNLDTGIAVDGSVRNTFTDITTLNNVNKGIILWVNANNNSFKNAIAQDIFSTGSSYNVFDNITSNDRTNGIELVTNSNYNSISNFVATNNTIQGVLLREDSNRNNFTNITSNNNANGFQFETTCNNNTVTNATANNNTAYGVYLYGSSYDNRFTDIISFNNAVGIGFDNSRNNTFIDSSLQDSLIADIYSATNSRNNLFLNTTFNSSLIGWDVCAPCNFTVKWYGRVNTTNSTSPLPASVNVSDVNGKSDFSSTAGINGLTSWFTLTDYVASSAGNTEFNPHAINASYSGVSNTTSFNFTGRDETANLTIYAGANVSDTTPPVLAFVYPTDLNLSVNRNYSFVNVSSDEPLSSATVNWNGTLYALTSLNSTVWYRNMTALGEGNYTFFATGYDLSSNPNTTDTRWVKVDTVAPSILFIPPTPVNSTSLAQTWVYLNVTINEPTENASVRFNGTTYYLLKSSSTLWYRNITGLAIGTYTYNVSANDSVNNSGISETRIITLSAPIITSCGDGICNGVETTDTCPADCPSLGGGGMGVSAYIMSNLLAGKCADGTAVGVCSSINPGQACMGNQLLQDLPVCASEQVSELPILPSWWSWNTVAILVGALGVVYFIAMFRRNQ